jgi:diaminobutyrate--2-oxoglutarate aminotransferase
MHILSAWFTRNPVAANLLMLLLLIAGGFALEGSRVESFPSIPASSVTAVTAYPGADAQQVDRGVSLKIEKALEGMPGIKKIIAYSEEGLSSLEIQKESRFDMDRFQNEIKSRIDAIDTLPQRAEPTVVTRNEFNMQALFVQVYGDVDPSTLQKTSRQLKKELLDHPNITKIGEFGLRPYEIRIEVDESRLRAYGLTMDTVARAIGQASLNYTAGSIDGHTGRVLIQADGEALTREEFAAIPVYTAADGTRILIQDVAAVIDGFEKDEISARFQGRPSVAMIIYTSPKGDLLHVSRAVHEIVDKFRSQLSDNIQVDVWGESAMYMKARLSLLETNAWQGLLIVFILLSLFLDIRLAFWVAAGIPISLAGTLMIMGDRFLGYSLNDITTFGMIIVLGILVDDAIVVGESVFDARSRGFDPVAGAIEGSRRVSTATVFGCFTTVAAFYPLLLIDNDIGKIFASFAVVVIVAVLFSLMESKLILPAHLACIKTDAPSLRNWPGRWWERLQNFTGRLLMAVNGKLYQPLLRYCLDHRYAVLVVLMTVAVCGIGMIAKGWIRIVFLPEVPGQLITIELETRSGLPASLIRRHVRTIEAAANAVNSEVMDRLGIDDPPIARLLSAITGPTSAAIYAELQPENNRRIETTETLRRWRKQVGMLEGVETLHFSDSLIDESSGGFTIELATEDEAVLKEAVQYLTEDLKRLEGVDDIRDDLQQGSPRIRLHLKPEAQHLGLTRKDLASQIGDAFGGLEVQRIQRGSEEVRVIVQQREDRRRSMHDIFNTRIQTSEGWWVPLTKVATIETGYVPVALIRRNGQRVVQVQASLNNKKISAEEAFAWVQQHIAPELKARYPQLTIKGAGELEETQEMKGEMKRTLIMILILIYALLAVPLKSYWQPFVIMAVIPFGFVGAVIGHGIVGIPLSILSFFGMLATAGVVVNDSLVLITSFNAVNRSSKPLAQSLINIGGSRFRVVFLTTATTVCGLLPLLTETSEQAQYLIPAAVSLAWGELFATPITLIFVPVLIYVAHDGARVCRKESEKIFSLWYQVRGYLRACSKTSSKVCYLRWKLSQNAHILHICSAFETLSALLSDLIQRFQTGANKTKLRRRPMKAKPELSVFKTIESEVRGYCRRFDKIFTTASGSIMRDVDGHEYIDFLAACGSLNYGHNDPDMSAALIEHISNSGIAAGLDLFSIVKQDFLDRFKHLILAPRRLDYRVQFTGPTGTNAVEAAMKLARKVTGRMNIIAFTNGFHGVSLNSLAATGNKFNRMGFLLPGISRAPYEGYFGAGLDTADYLDQLLSDPSSGIDAPAAILLETVQGEGGLNAASPKWLQRIAAISKEHGALLIVDDVQAGCGRTGTFFSFEKMGIVPDMVVMSKSISGFGLPMAIVLMKPVYDQWKPAQHNGTFRGNLHAFVTSRIALEKFWSDSAFSRSIAAKASLVTDYLTHITKLVPDSSRKGRGMMQGINVGSGDLADQICRLCFENGLIIETSGAFNEVIKVMAPLTTPFGILKEGLDILYRATLKIMKESPLPRIHPIHKNKEQVA